MGGLDACLWCWDLRTIREPQEYLFESQIISLTPILGRLDSGGHSQWLSVVAAHLQGILKHTVGWKDSTTHGLESSPPGQWRVAGMDSLVSIYTRPQEPWCSGARDCLCHVMRHVP